MKKLFISSVIATLFVSSGFGQVVETVMGAKLVKYHAALLKRPESKSLFQKFQTGWLAENNEKSLEKFLKTKAGKGSVADKQLYAYFLMQKGKEQEVIEALTSALAVDKDNAQVYLDRANAYSRLLDFERAVVDVNKALELAEKTGEDDSFTLIANKLKGRFLTRQGKTDEAVAHWKNLVKNNPKDQELIEDVIDILIADSLSPSALELSVNLRDDTKDSYKKALRTLRVGDILSKQGEMDKALETYVNTLDLSGDGSWLEREIIGQVQTIFKKEDNLNGLAKKFSELVKKYPQRVHIENKLAEVLVELERFGQAKKIYQSLLKKSPLDDDMKFAYFNMLKRSEDFNSARGLIDSMIKRKPDDAQLHLQRAGLSYDLEVKGDVLGDLANYKKIAKVNALTAVNYASLLNQYGFEKEAIASYKGAVTEYPDSIDTAIAAAQFLHDKKQKNEAVKIWSGIALKVDRDNLIRLLDTLVLNAQGNQAIELVKSNYDKYKTNLSFLGAAIRIAEYVKDDKLAIKYAFTQLVLAEKPIEVDQAINMASRFAIKTDKVDENIKRLRSKGDLSDREKFLLADLEEASGELMKADKLLVELAKSDKVINLLLLARVYERRYELEKAAASIENLIKLPNGLKAVHLRRLYGIYQRAGNIKQALATIQRWKTLSPNDKNVWLAEVDLLKAVDGPKAALESLRKGAQRFKGDKDILAKLAGLNSASSRHSHASLLYWRLYDESEDMNDHIRWAGELARSARILGTMAKLVDELTRRRRNSPKSVVPIMALAEVYRVNYQFKERRSILLEATRLRPDDVFLMIELASIDMRNGANKDAISILRKAQKLDKTGAVSYRLASLFISEGDFEEALEELEKTFDKVDLRVVEDLVMKLMQQDALDEARAYLKKSLVKFPDDWRLLLLNSVILYEQGYSKRAAESALGLLSRNNKIKSLIQGWEVNMPRKKHTMMMVNESMPDKYVRLGLISQASRSFTLLRQSKNQAMFSRSYPGVSGSSHLLPINLKSLHLMANVLFFKALDDLSENDQKDLLAQADKAGIDDPELMFELHGLDTNKNRNQRTKYADFLSDRIKKNPDNREYYNYLVISKILTDDLILPKAILNKARELNKGPNDVFIRSYLAMFGEAEMTGKEHSEKILAEIKEDDKLEDHEIQLLIKHNQQMFSRRRESKNTESDVLAVFKRYFEENKGDEIVDPYQQQGDGKNQLRKQMMYSLRGLFQAELFRGDDYKAIIAAIESKAYGPNNNYYNYSSGRSRRSMVNALTTVEKLQLVYFTDTKGENGHSLDKAKVKDNLNFFKNPILKIIAIRYADAQRDVIPLLDIAKKDPNSKADAHLLHAYVLFENNKPTNNVLEQLNLARQNTLNKSQRIAINSFLLNTGLNMGKHDFDKLDDELKEAVRVVSRRLMISRQITSPKEIQKIIKIFSMEKEQARFLNRNNTSARNQISGLAGMNLNSTQKSGSNNAFMVKLKKEMAKKLTDRAAYLAYQKLRSILKQSRNRSRDLDQFIQGLKKLKLSELVLDRMNPKDSVSVRKWLDYYEVGKMLGDEKVQAEAIDYFSILAVVPQRSRTAIALAIYATRREKAIELLSGSHGAEEGIFAALSSDLKKNSKKPEAYIYSLEFINHYISNLGDKTSDVLFDSYSYQQLFRQYLEMQRAGEKNARFSYTAVDKKNKDLIRRRDIAYEDFIRSAMKSKDCAESAFIHFLRDAPKATKFSNANITMVKESVLITVKIKTRSSQYIPGAKSVFDQFSSRVTYLAQAISFKKDNSLLDDAFLAEIKPLNKVLHSTLQGYKKLLLVSDASVLEEMAVLKQNANLVDFISWFNFLSLKSDQKVDLQFVEYFIGYLRGSKEKVNIQDSAVLANISKLIKFSFDSLYKNKKQKMLLDLIDKKISQLVKKMKAGEFASWAEIISNDRSNPKSMDDFVIATFMSDMMVHPISLSDGINLVQKHQCPIGLFAHFQSSNLAITIELYDRLLAAGYLNSPYKMKLTKMPVYDSERLKDQVKQHSKVSNFGDTASAIQLMNEVDGIKTSYDIQYLAKSYKIAWRYSDNMKRLVSNLNKAPKENKYGAALFLTMMDKKTFESFIQEHASSLKNAPKQHLAALHAIFNLDASTENQMIVKHNKIEYLFPIDRAVQKHNLIKESAVFLGRKKPFVDHELDEANGFVKKFISDNVASDFVQTSKVVNHYVMLLDQSRAAMSEWYSLPQGRSSYLQEVLIYETFGVLAYDQHISSFNLLRLVYGLDQLPIRNELNIARLIRATMPRNWPYRAQYQKLDLKSVIKRSLLEEGKLYDTLTDDNEKMFMKVAWWIYFISDPNYVEHDSFIEVNPNLVNSLSSQNPKLKGFLDVINKAIPFDKHWFEALYDFGKPKNNKVGMLNNIWDYYSNSKFFTLKAEMESLPVRYRCIVLNNIMNLNAARTVVTRSKNLRKLFVDTYEEAIKEDPDLGYSDDTRYMNMLSIINEDKFSVEQKQRLSAIGKSNVEKQIQYINGGKMIHQNHFAGNCALLAMTDEGKNDLLAFYRKEPRHFKHVLPIAKLFLKCGFVAEIPWILSGLKNGAYKRLSGRSLVAGYESDADTPTHLQKLLKLYNTNREKALILSFVNLEPQKSFKNKYKSDEFDVYLAGAEFANNAYKEGDVENLENALHSIYVATSIPAAGKLDEVFKDGGSMVRLHLKELYSGSGNSRERRTMFRVYISYLYAKGRYEELFKIADEVLRNVVKTSKNKDKSLGEEYLFIRLCGCFEFIIKTGYIHMYDLYSAHGVKGETDDELKKFLPFIRKYNELCASVSGIYHFSYDRNEDDVIWHPLAGHRQMSKLIHEDLGEAKVYTDWFNALNSKVKKQMQPRMFFPMNCYLEDFKNDSIGYGLIKQHVLLFNRFFNSKAYQKYVAEHQHSTEHLAIAMDHSAMSAQQVVDLYDQIEIEYKVPGFEAAKYGDLAHAYHRLEQYDKIVPLYAKMNEVLVKYPPIDQSVLAMTYYHQMRHLWIIKELEKALQVMPKGLEDKLDKETRQEYDKAVLEIQKWLNKKEVEK